LKGVVRWEHIAVKFNLNNEKVFLWFENVIIIVTWSMKNDKTDKNNIIIKV